MSKLELLQKRYDEAIQEIALLRHVLYLSNESLSGNFSATEAEEPIGATVAGYHWRETTDQSNTVEKVFVLELAKLLFNAGVTPSSELFDEKGYLSLNTDVADAIKSRRFASGFEHWLVHGLSEGRGAAARDVNAARLSDEVIFLYRAYKIKKARKSKLPLNFLFRFFAPPQQKAIDINQ